MEQELIVRHEAFLECRPIERPLLGLWIGGYYPATLREWQVFRERIQSNPLLLDGPATVDHDGLAGDVAGTVADQERDDPIQFRNGDENAFRHGLEHDLADHLILADTVLLRLVGDLLVN